jgi:hypothetical protein
MNKRWQEFHIFINRWCQYFNDINPQHLAGIRVDIKMMGKGKKLLGGNGGVLKGREKQNIAIIHSFLPEFGLGTSKTKVTLRTVLPVSLMTLVSTKQV